MGSEEQRQHGKREVGGQTPLAAPLRHTMEVWQGQHDQPAQQQAGEISAKFRVRASPRNGMTETGLATAASGGNAETIICGSTMPLHPAIPLRMAHVTVIDPARKGTQVRITAANVSGPATKAGRGANKRRYCLWMTRKPTPEDKIPPATCHNPASSIVAIRLPVCCSGAHRLPPNGI